MEKRFGKQYAHELIAPRKAKELYACGGKIPLIVLIPGVSATAEEQPTRGLTETFQKEGLNVLRFDMRDNRREPEPLVKKTDYVVEILHRILEEHPEIDNQRIVILGHSQGGAIIRHGLGRIREKAENPFVVTLSSIPDLTLIRKAARATHRAFFPNITEEQADKIIDKMLYGFDEKNAVDHLSAYPGENQLHVFHKDDESMLEEAFPFFERSRPNLGFRGDKRIIDMGIAATTPKEKIKLHIWEDTDLFNSMLDFVLPWVREKITPKPDKRYKTSKGNYTWWNTMTNLMTAKFKHFNDGDAWMLAEDIPQLDFFFAQIWLQSFVNNLERSCGRNYSKILGVFEWPDMKFYYGRNDCREMAEHLVRKIREEPKFGDKINRNIIIHSDRLQRHAESIPADLAKKSNAELCGIIEEHARIHTALYEWGWLSNATDMFYPEYTELLKSYLRTKSSDEEEVNTFFVTLTSPDGLSAEAFQHREFLEMAVEIDNDDSQRKLFASAQVEKIADELHPAFTKMFYEYSKKYEAMGALWIGNPFPPRHYLREMSLIFRSGKSPAEELQSMQSGLEAKKKAKEALFKQLKVTPKYRHLFGIFAGFMLTKFHRRYAQLRAIYAMRRVFEEISKRLGLSFAQSRLLLTQEYRQLLVDGTFDARQLREREKLCALYSEKGANVIFTGAEAKKLAGNAEEKLDLSATQITGQCASLGKAKGAAKIILSPADAHKMNQGDILIAIATNPDVVPAMKKAAAIVTEQGGVTCHAAIVSRELGIPCVIGTKIATKWLKDGDLVEVDATKGSVRKLA